MKSECGVIHGRFQGLHNGHMEYLLAGKSRCRFLYIGITNPDPSLIRENAADLKRSRDDANPFTYFERMEMLRDALVEAGVQRSEFDVVPFPINTPQLIQYYTPTTATYYVTIYDAWGRTKAETLTSLGLRVEVMWERTMAQRLTTGTEVRQLISGGKPWRNLVPNAVAEYITRHKLETRCRW
jgi:cytidyltransferase-like protein